MGNTQRRLDMSAVVVGAPDANGLSNSIMQVVEVFDNYFGVIYVNTVVDIHDIPFKEYINGGKFLINGSTSVPQNVDICMLDSYRACSTLIREVADINTGQNIPLSRIQFESATTACWTYRYRLGSILIDDSNALTPETAENGYLCRISVGDYRASAQNESSCCRGTHLNFDSLNFNQQLSDIYQQFVNTSNTNRGTCPMIYSNGFTTDHCNTTMDSYCSTNANTPECIMYMLSQLENSRPTLSPFVEYCSQHLHDRVCQFMAIRANDLGFGESADRALINYCTNNPSDRSCICYNASIKLPNTFSNNSYIGPLVCWYKPCAETTESQFLLSEQLLQRRGCDISTCIIDVGNINIDSNDPSIVTLINDCNSSLRNKTKIPLNEKRFFDDPVWNLGYMGLLKISLFSIAVLIPLILR